MSINLLDKYLLRFFSCRVLQRTRDRMKAYGTSTMTFQTQMHHPYFTWSLLLWSTYKHSAENPFGEWQSYQRAAGGEDRFDRGVASSTVATTGRINPLLFLSSIAEPDPNHLLLHVELVSDHGDLFRGRFLVLLEEGKEARDSLSALRKLLYCGFSTIKGD